MGPNGSGKSTLAYSIAGHPKYTITGGTVTLDGDDVLAMSVDERARAGLFLAMQYPVEVPGVSVSNFLRTAATAVKGEAPKLRTWVKDVKSEMDLLEMDSAFAERNVNEGFSGGEKKRHEIDRKSTRLNSSHANISYAVFRLKKTSKLENPLPDKSPFPAHLVAHPVRTWRSRSCRIQGRNSRNRRRALREVLTSTVRRLRPTP